MQVDGHGAALAVALPHAGRLPARVPGVVDLVVEAQQRLMTTARGGHTMGDDTQ
jgi:hypothetical protein